MCLHPLKNLRHTSTAMLCLISLSAFAQVENNPGYDRPGIGFSPSVLQSGDFMLEQGLPDWSYDAGTSLYNADTLLRFGIGHALELQLGSGWSQQNGGGTKQDGRADTSLAVKFARSATDKISWGVLGSIELTDGAPVFRAVNEQYLLGGSVNWQLSEDNALGLYAEAVHGDTNNQLLAVNDG